MNSGDPDRASAPRSRPRVAAVGDAEDVVRLVRSAYRGEASRPGWTSEADLVGGDRIDGAQVRDMIGDPDTVVLVLPGDDGLLACCHIRDLGDGLAGLGTLAVAPTRQGGGLGGVIMAEALRQAREAFAAAAVELSALAQQEQLIAWYERLGFVRTGETPPFPADARHARPKRAGLYFVQLRLTLSDIPDYPGGTTTP